MIKFDNHPGLDELKIVNIKKSNALFFKYKTGRNKTVKWAFSVFELKASVLEILKQYSVQK